MDVAPNREFSQSGNLLVSLKFTSDLSPLPWERKFVNFSTLAITHLI